MTQLLQAVVLGAVQGLTEFLPISSSGHLILLEKLFGWAEQGLSFDVAVHIGTLLALLVYFRREWIAVIRGFFTSFKARPRAWDLDQRLAWMIVLASIPAAAVGALLGDTVEENLRAPALIALMLIVGGLIMLAAELLGRKERGFESLHATDAGVVGLAQVLALAPGVSRSGITISGGMLAGLDREAAARFSFMLSAPIIAGAGLWQGAKLAREGFADVGPGVFAVGFVTSAVVGFFTVKYLLVYFRRHTLAPFIVYRFALAAVVLLVVAFA